MHGERMALSHAAWADLDALVLEEVNALDAVEAPPPEVLAFSSEDEFLAQAIAYLRQREDPLRLIAALTGELGLAAAPEPELADEQFELDDVPPAPAPPAEAGPAAPLEGPPS